MKTKVAHLRIKLFTATGRRFKKKIEKKELTYKLKYTEDENFYIIFYKNKQQGKFNKLNNKLHLKEYKVEGQGWVASQWPDIDIQFKKRELAGWQLRKCFKNNIFEYTNPTNHGWLADVRGYDYHIISSSIEFTK